MDLILQDVRYALRMLRKAPGATAVAVLTLAIGISATTTAFSWMRSVLLNPLPGVRDAGRVVTLETVTPSGEMIDASYPDYRDFRDRMRLADGVIAFKERALGLGDETDAERVWALMVSGNYFDVLGVSPELGRFFEGAERGDVFDAAPVAILGDALWRGRFNADPGIIGRTIVLNRQRYTVIGVTPPAFPGTITGLRFDLYVPLTMQRSLTGGSQWLASRTSRPLYLFARLKPGVTLDQGRAEAASIGQALAREYPNSNRGFSATLLTQQHARRGVQSDLGPLVRILLALAVVVLAIVCANVANLQLARAGLRRREVALRAGLGASRGRLLAQVLVEHLVLASLAGLAALLMTAWLVSGLWLLVPFVEYPLVLTTTMRAGDFLFAALASVLAALAVGVVPAVRLSGVGLAQVLKDGGRGAGADTRIGRLRAGLVVSEVALAMVALVSAGLLVRSFDNARRASTGFDPGGVVLAGVNVSTGGYTRAEGLRLIDRIEDRLGTLPGAMAVSVSEDVPLGFNGGSWEDVQVDGYVPAVSEDMKIYRNLVEPGYFHLMRIPLVAGRDFTRQDDDQSAAVAVVNQEFERRFFEGRSAVGRRLRLWGRWATIVGVVATSKYHALAESPQPYFYAPLRQTFNSNTGLAVHVRGEGDLRALGAEVREALRSLDPRLPQPLMTTLADYIGASYFAQRVASVLLSVLAGLALLLASVGLYSLISYGVATRRQEIGVRMALGASARDILRMIVGEGARMAALGVVAGVALALLATRALATLLFGVAPADLATLAASAVLLASIALAASYIPARAATRIEPSEALRAE